MVALGLVFGLVVTFFTLGCRPEWLVQRHFGLPTVSPYTRCNSSVKLPSVATRSVWRDLVDLNDRHDPAVALVVFDAVRQVLRGEQFRGLFLAIPPRQDGLEPPRSDVQDLRRIIYDQDDALLAWQTAIPKRSVKLPKV